MVSIYPIKVESEKSASKYPMIRPLTTPNSSVMVSPPLGKKLESCFSVE